MNNMAKQNQTRKKRREQRKKEGLCQQCPNKTSNGKSLCASCLAKMKERHKKRQNILKLKKLCTRCKEPVDGILTMCRKCLDAWRDVRKERISNNFCPYCGSHNLRSKSICELCYLKRKEQAEIKKNAGICTSLGCKNSAVAGKVSCQKCIDERCAKLRDLKKKVLDHYGHRCSCLCGCLATNSRHLTIDHKNNDGAIQRRSKGMHGGQANYRMIIKSGFPDDLQILCWNCNCAKHFYGGCI